MDLVEWIAEEMYARLSVGKPGGEAAAEVMALVFEFGRADELLKDGRGEWLISNIWARSARRARRGPSDQPADLDYYSAPRSVLLAQRATQMVGAVESVMTEHRFAALRKSIFFAPISVGRKWIEIGAMRQEDWLAKAREYEMAAQKDMERAEACSTIAQRLTGNRTTRECLSEDEFTSLLPDNGL